MKNKLIAILLSLTVFGGAGFVIFSSGNDSNSKENTTQQEVVSSDKQVTTEKNDSGESNKNDLINSNKANNSVETSFNSEENGISSVDEVEEARSIVETNSVDNSLKQSSVDNSPKQSLVESTPVVEQQSVQEQAPVIQQPVVFEEETQAAPIADSNFLSEVESAIFTIVNQERTNAGLSPLTYNGTMEHYARIKSQDMGDRGYFSHQDPQGNLITVRMQNDGVSYNAWGENIAYISGITMDANAIANQFMTNWMNSQGHRANILSTNFSSIGVGVYKVGNTIYATQEFYR